MMSSPSKSQLQQRIRQLQHQQSLQNEHILQLKTQNQQLMAIVVQASHHAVNRNTEFVERIEKMVLGRYEESGKGRAREGRSGEGKLRLRTEGSARKCSIEQGRTAGKENDNGNTAYVKMSKGDLKGSMERLHRIERRVF